MKCTNLKQEEATWVLFMDKKTFDPSECRQPSFIWVFLVVCFDDTVELEVHSSPLLEGNLQTAEDCNIDLQVHKLMTFKRRTVYCIYHSVPNK